MKRVFLYNLITIILIFFSLEIFLRLTSIIELQGFNKKSIFIENDIIFHKPNIMMDIMGKKSKTDINGFRIPLKDYKYDDKKKSVLVLGDSVSFGVSVEEKNTFIGRLRTKINSNLLNASVAGYTIEDYSYLIEKYNKNFPLVKDVVIFLCINDIVMTDGILRLENSKQISHHDTDNFFVKFLRKDFFVKLNFYLRDKSALFNLLKSVSTNNVERYYNYMTPYYSNNTYLNEYKKNLDKIINFASSNNLNVKFVLLPYKFQIKKHCEKSFMNPQIQINELFNALQYQLFDFSDEFCNKKGANRLFLNFDPMHLSSTGHELVSELLIKNEVFK